MHTLVSRLTLAAVLASMTVGAASAAETLTPAEQQAAYDWALNNAEFVLYHEVGHLLIDQLDLPVLGREEDAADNLATMTLLNQGTVQAEETLRDAAQGWLLSGEAEADALDASYFYDSHSLSLQRAYAIVCQMVGSNQAEYTPVANQYGLDTGRQESCAYDFETLQRSYDALFNTNRSAANSHGASVEVIYQQAGGRLQEAAEVFKASGVFERIAEELESNLHLSHHITFRARRCGEANAYYDATRVEVTFCYELMDAYIDLIETQPLDELVAREQTAATETTVPEKQKTS
jgi:hypothetical protein